MLTPKEQEQLILDNWKLPYGVYGRLSHNPVVRRLGRDDAYSTGLLTMVVMS